jgi:hypothetical protein
MHGPFAEAQVIYGPSQFEVVKPGTFVRCAVTSTQIPLEELRYWSVARQEGYATAAAALDAEERARQSTGEG